MRDKSYAAYEHERAEHHDQLRYDAAQPIDPDNLFDDESAPSQPPLPDGSFADSAAAIQDRERFFAVLATVFEAKTVETIRENLQEQGTK